MPEPDATRASLSLINHSLLINHSIQLSFFPYCEQPNKPPSINQSQNAPNTRALLLPPTNPPPHQPNPQPTTTNTILLIINNTNPPPLRTPHSPPKPRWQTRHRHSPGNQIPTPPPHLPCTRRRQTHRFNRRHQRAIHGCESAV